MTASTPISIGSAFEFVFTACAPEILKVSAKFKGNLAWQGFAQDLIFSRDIMPYTLGATVVSAIGYGLAKKCNSPIAKTLSRTALTVSTLALGFSGLKLLSSICIFRGWSSAWNNLYPNHNIDRLLLAAKMLNGRECVE